MDAVSYALSAKQKERIERVNANPDSNSGIVTVPSVIAAGDSVTIPAGRTAVLPNVQVDGTLNIEGEVFIPSGATFSKVVETEGNQTITGVKTFTSSPIVPTPTAGTQAANKEYVDNNGVILQVVYAENKVVGSGSLTIPADGTIPQITEGNEILTCTITPKKANSRLLIEFTPSTEEISNSGDVITVACFRNGVSDALYQTTTLVFNTMYLTENNITGRFIIDTPTTSPITFSLRAGVNLGSIRWNQILHSSPIFMNASTTMTITEIAQ